ncbi:hypothetical protein LLG34_00875 [bacterium]|nr:hypothetical protein [bacterium]
MESNLKNIKNYDGRFERFYASLDTKGCSFKSAIFTFFNGANSYCMDLLE